MDNWIVILIIVVISFLKWLFGENGLKRMLEAKKVRPTFTRENETATSRPPVRPSVGSPAPPLHAPASRWPEGRPEMRPSQGPQSPSHRPSAAPASARTAEEEKVRKFLEALGLPADAPAPAPVRERVPQGSAQSPMRGPHQPARQHPLPPPIPVAPQPAPASAHPPARQTRAARAADDAAKLPEAFVSPEEEVRRERAADTVTSDAQREKQKRAYTKGMGQEIGMKKVGGEGGALKRGAALRERLREPRGLADAVLLAEILGEPVGQRRS